MPNIDVRQKRDEFLPRAPGRRRKLVVQAATAMLILSVLSGGASLALGLLLIVLLRLMFGLFGMAD